MDEIWNDVVGYEGLYQVSNLGRVKSCAHIVSCKNGTRTQPSKILTPQTDKKKNFYFFVRLYKKGKFKLFFVHRLVATAFIANPNNYPQVNHINGNKRDNVVVNLEWCTAAQNVKHAFNTGLNTTRITHYRGVEAFLLKDNSFVGEYNSLHEAAKKLNLNIGHICSVLHGRVSQTCGYYFKYSKKEKLQNRIY